MALEFQIGLVDQTPGGPGGQAAGTAAPAPLSEQEMARLVKEFGREMAEQIARHGYINATPLNPPVHSASSAAAGPPTAAEQTIDQQIVPALAANAAGVAALLRETPAEVAAAKEEAAQEEEGNLLPSGELRLEGDRAPGDILPADLRLAGELPGDAADRARRESRAQAARANLEAGPAQIEEPPEVLSLAHEQAQAQIEAGHHAARVRAARANLEEGPADVIDPADEGRQEQAKQLSDHLNSGSRVAAQAGLGATGQAIGGTADLVSGIATGNVGQAVQGGLELLQAAVHGTAEAFDSARQVIEVYSHDVQAAAGNDYWAILDGHLEATSDALEKVPIEGEALAAAFNLAAAPVRAFHDVVEAFVARGHELQAFSAELSVSNAMADVRSTLADIQEAQELGPELARMTDAQSQLQDELRELFLPVKKVILENLAPVLEFIRDNLAALRVLLSEIKELGQIGQEFFNDVFGTGHVADIPTLLLNIDARLKRAAEDARALEDKEAPMRILTEIAKGLDMPGAAANPAAAAAGTGLHIPGLEGGF